MRLWGKRVYVWACVGGREWVAVWETPAHRGPPLWCSMFNVPNRERRQRILSNSRAHTFTPWTGMSRHAETSATSPHNKNKTESKPPKETKAKGPCNATEPPQGALSHSLPSVPPFFSPGRPRCSYLTLFVTSKARLNARGSWRLMCTYAWTCLSACVGGGVGK